MKQKLQFRLQQKFENFKWKQSNVDAFKKRNQEQDKCSFENYASIAVLLIGRDSNQWPYDRESPRQLIVLSIQYPDS